MTFLFDFSQKHPFVQLLILICFMIAGALLSTLFAYAVGMLVWGTEIVFSGGLISDVMPSKQISFMKFTQFCNQVGMLLLPAAFFAWCSGRKTFDYLRMKKSGGAVAILIAVVVVVVVSPFISMLQEWNAAMQFPAWMQLLENMMKTMEEQAESLTKIFVETTSIGGLLLNLGLMAMLPAFAEEMFFRGAVQNIFRKWMKNDVWAIVVTAIIFSGFHFQFYGFFPRFVLGLILGVLYVMSGSLWVPIVAHFTNNATAVIIGFLEFNGFISITAEEFGQTENPIWIALSVMAVLGLFWILKRQKKRL